MTSKAERIGRLRQTGLIAIMMVLSQAVSALATLSIAQISLSQSDLYSIGLQVGTGAFSGYVVGVVYLVAVGRPGYNDWRRQQLFAFLFSLVLACTAILVRTARGGCTGTDIAILFAFGIGGGALGCAGVRAVEEACRGRPSALPGITLIPNLGLCTVATALKYTHAPAQLALIVPAMTWMALAFGLFVNRERTYVNQSVDNQHSVSSARLHVASLSLGTVASTVMPVIYGSAMAILKDGTTTWVYLLNRIGSSGVSVIVNSTLMAKYDWKTKATRDFKLIGLLAIPIAPAITLSYFLSSRPTNGYIVLGVTWLFTLAIAPIPLREVNARRLARWISAKVLLDITSCLIGVAALYHHATIAGFFAVMTCSQCITLSVSGAALNDKRLTASGAAGAVACWWVAWHGW